MPNEDEGIQQGAVRGHPVPTPNDWIERDVDRFALAMKNKLKQKAHYGYWFGLPLNFYSGRLRGELRELQDALQTGDMDALMKEAADVANLAMMLYANAREARDAPS